jgi:hypothetical protein
MKKMFLLLVGALLVVETASAMSAENGKRYFPWLCFASYALVGSGVNIHLRKAHDGPNATLDYADKKVQAMVHQGLRNIGMQGTEESIIVLKGDPEQSVNRFMATEYQIVIPEKEHDLLCDFANDLSNDEQRSQAEEFLAILEHEAAHVKHMHTKKKGIANLVIPAATIAASGLALYATGHYKRIEPHSREEIARCLIFSLGLGYYNGVFNRTLACGLSRHYEQQADDAVTNPRALVRWLSKNPTGHLEFLDRTILNTHPSHEHRIARFKARAEKMEEAKEVDGPPSTY